MVTKDRSLEVVAVTHVGLLLTSSPPTPLRWADGPNEDRLVLQMGMWVSVEHGGMAAQSIFQLPSLPPGALPSSS